MEVLSIFFLFFDVYVNIQSNKREFQVKNQSSVISRSRKVTKLRMKIELLMEGWDEDFWTRGENSEILPKGENSEVFPKGGDSEIFVKGWELRIFIKGWELRIFGKR